MPFPLHGVPLWMELLAKIDPLTYGVDLLRQVALRGHVPEQFLDALVFHPMATNLAIMTAFGLAFLAPAVWLFSKQD